MGAGGRLGQQPPGQRDARTSTAGPSPLNAIADADADTPQHAGGTAPRNAESATRQKAGGTAPRNAESETRQHAGGTAPRTAESGTRQHASDRAGGAACFFNNQVTDICKPH